MCVIKLKYFINPLSLFLMTKLATRQMGRFAGFSLYVSNTTDRQSGYLCYKDGPPELPLLNFNTDCNSHGRYVIFYNERLDGIQYPQGYEDSNVLTELCEVTVTGIYFNIIKLMYKSQVFETCNLG